MNILKKKKYKKNKILRFVNQTNYAIILDTNGIFLEKHKLII